MGLLSFIKDAGEKLLGIGGAKAAEAAKPELAAQSIVDYIKAQGIDTAALTVGFDSASTTVSVGGTVPGAGGVYA